jgi:hypothetical protein
MRSRWVRAACLTAAGVAAGGLIALAVLATAAAAAGVFNTAPGNWTVRLVPFERWPAASLAVNVPGVVRLATSPLGRWLLDGRSVGTRFGRLRFRRHGPTLIVECAPCTVTDARLASQPIAAALGLRLTPRVDAAAAGRIEGLLTAPGFAARFEATLAASGIEIAWSLPATELAALVRLLGAAIPEARFARVAGTVAAEGTLHLPSLAGHASPALADLAVDGLGTEALASGLFEQRCAAPDGAPRRVLNGDGSRFWSPLDDLGARLPGAVLAAEDPHFFEHAGFDGQPLAAAFAAGAAHGAHTITQRLARTLFIGDERGAAGELRALLYAAEMQRTLGKRRILELYLNTADWGPGICGARTAARVYFRKTPAQLTALQAAWLAASLRRPQAAYEREFLRGVADSAGALRVLAQMHELPADERARARRERLAFAPAPKRAPGAPAPVAAAR